MICRVSARISNLPAAGCLVLDVPDATLDPVAPIEFFVCTRHISNITKSEADSAAWGKCCQVSGPEGWHFERSSVGVVVDETNQCENGEDIIFQYTGFSLTGRVKGAVSAISSLCRSFSTTRELCTSLLVIV